DVDDARVDAVGDLHRLPHVAEDADREPVLARVGELDGLLDGAEGDDGSDRTEYLLGPPRVVTVDAAEHGGPIEQCLPRTTGGERGAPRDGVPDDGVDAVELLVVDDGAQGDLTGGGVTDRQPV